MWFDEDGEDAAEIASRLRRDPTTIRRFLTHGHINSRRKGRPRALGEQQIDRLVKLVNAEVQKAGGKYAVTLEFIRTWCRVLSAMSLRGSHQHVRSKYKVRGYVC